MRQHAVKSAPWLAPAPRLALRLTEVPARDASDRPLPSHFFVRAPVPHRFPVGHELSPALSRGSPAITSERFASAGRTRVILCTSAGVVFPSRCVRPSLWHPCRVSHGKQPRSRESRRPESCRGHRPHARVKAVTCGVMARDVFRPTRTVAPRRPLGRPAPDFALTAAWPPHRAQSAPFHPRGPLRASAGQAPVHASRCRRECASLGLGDAHRLLQPDIDARARPSSVSILAREWSLSSSAARRQKPLSVASTVASRRRAAGSASHDQLDVREHGAIHLRGSRWSRAYAPEQRLAPAANGKVAPFSQRFGHPGRRRDGEGGLEPARPLACRPRCSLNAVSRKADVRRRTEVPSTVPKPSCTSGRISHSRRDEDRVRLTPPPWRHCSAARAPSCPFPHRLDLTIQAAEMGRSTVQRGPRLSTAR